MLVRQTLLLPDGGGRPAQNPHLHPRQRSEGLHGGKQGDPAHTDLHRGEGGRQERPRADHRSGPLLRTPDVQGHPAVRHPGLRGRKAPARHHRTALRALPHPRRRGAAQGPLPPHRQREPGGLEAGHSQRVRQTDGRHRSQRHQRLHRLRPDRLRGGYPLEPNRQLGPHPGRPLQERGHPRIPHRAGDHLRGEEHVADQRHRQGVRQHTQHALPPPPLRHAGHSGHPGAPEEPLHHQRQEVPRHLLRAQQHGHLPLGRLRPRGDDCHPRQILRRHGSQPGDSRAEL